MFRCRDFTFCIEVYNASHLLWSIAANKWSTMPCFKALESTEQAGWLGRAGCRRWGRNCADPGHYSTLVWSPTPFFCLKYKYKSWSLLNFSLITIIWIMFSEQRTVFIILHFFCFTIWICNSDRFGHFSIKNMQGKIPSPTRPPILQNPLNAL